MQNIYDLIIIGGGPAGITAGIYGARKKLNILLLTRDFVGQVGKISEIENWPGFEKISGQELMQNILNHFKKFACPPTLGVKTTGGREIEIKEGEDIKEIKKEGDIFEIESKRGNKFNSRAVIIASGRIHRLLGVPGEKEFTGRGVSFCSICDSPFFKDKKVAVIGGGNSGFRTALDLIPYAKKIYIFDALSKIKADEIFQERAEKSGKIEIILNTKVEEIKGKDKVERLLYQDLVSKEKKELAIDGVFIEIGSIPATDFLKDLVDFDEAGDIIINPKTCETKTAGLFAAGDVTDVEYKQIIIAAGEGAKAGLSAYEYLQKSNK